MEVAQSHGNAPLRIPAGYHWLAFLLGVPLGIFGFLVGLMLSMGEVSTPTLVTCGVLLGFVLGLASPAAIAGAVLGVVVLGFSEFSGGGWIVVLLCLGGLPALPLGIRMRRRVLRLL